MTQEFDMELARLFDEKAGPAPDETFTKGVAGRIARHRRVHRIKLLLLAISGAALLAVLTPWLAGLTSYMAIVSSFISYSVVAVILSPVGWVMGGWIGLNLFLKMRQ